MKKAIKTAIVISDIRNFTGTFAQFEKIGSSAFKDFISEFYDIQIKIADIISKNYWYNTIGDSMIFIFNGKNHSKSAYTFSMILHRIMTKYCAAFNKIHNTEINFGIGVDCGDVWEMKGLLNHKTYLGNSINVVTRIEALTKTFGETELLVGGHIYDYLMQDLYPNEYADARLFKTNYTEILKSKPALVLMSENLLIHYIFKLKLTGIEKSLPLFRYDNDLAADDGEFWYVVSKLVTDKVKDNLINLIK